MSTSILRSLSLGTKFTCISPFIERHNVTAQQINFNHLHAKTRQVIERSFALLFGRFRRLRYLDMNRLDLIPATVTACCVLHNVCLANNDELARYEDEGRDFFQRMELGQIDAQLEAGLPGLQLLQQQPVQGVNQPALEPQVAANLEGNIGTMLRDLLAAELYNP